MALSRPQLLEKLAQLEGRYSQLEQALAAQAGKPVDAKRLQGLSKELSDLREVAQPFRAYQQLSKHIEDINALLQSQAEAEMRQMAQEELAELQQRQSELLRELEQLWLKRNEEPERPFIMEIRAGTGGLEASLFAADLYRMYSKYAAKYGWQVEPMESSRSEAGGFKEIGFSVKGRGAWKHLQYESGVHRVQRVPETEAQGRIHTSTVTVAVLPEPAEVDLPPIAAKDLQIDVYRASGPGGQGVNTTDSAVRIRHLPTGLMVTCQDERSQLRNKEKAMRVLRARLLDLIQMQQQQQIASNRKQQVGSGDRSEKIRTYNFPDRRITDHRIGLTLHKLDQVMEGELEELTEALVSAGQAKKLA